MVDLKVNSVISAWVFYHNNSVHSRIKPLQRLMRPLGHFLMGVAFAPARKIKKSDFPFIKWDNVLIYRAVLVLYKTQPH